MEKAFLTQNLIKPQMALEEKPQDVLLISKYQLTGKKRKRQKKSNRHSKFMYTHKEKSRQWIGEEAVMVGIDMPCIFTLW